MALLSKPRQTLHEGLVHLMFMEAAICRQDAQGFASGAYAKLSHAHWDARHLFLSFLFLLKTRHPEYFEDPTVFYLAVAYMDRVLCSKTASRELKSSVAMPMACALIAMKVFLAVSVLSIYLHKS